MAKNLKGGRQGVRGGFDFPRVADIPGVEELPQGGKTSQVTLKGYGVPGADELGWGGDRNSPAT